MNWKRSTCGLLLGGSLCVFNVGCAAFNAMVSSPAGHSATHGSPERIAAIGRVFENQGKFVHAENMYRRALSADPSNSVAKERLQYIANRSTERSFAPSAVGKPKQSMIAVADSLNSNRRRKPRRLGTTRPANAAVAEVETAVAKLSEAPAQVELTAVPVATPEPDVMVSHASPATIAELDTVSSDAGEIALANPGWKIDESYVSADANALDVTDAVATSINVDDISTVAFEGDDSSVETIPSMDTSWQPSDRVVTFEQLMEWADAPDQNASNLVFALTAGESEPVQAFAATLLADCGADDGEVNAALQHVCQSGTPLLRVSCRDTLIQRGEITEEGVSDLLVLMSDENVDVRAQAAASLRNVVGTEWAPQCVVGLQSMLVDADATIVAVAAATLGDFGNEAASARDALRRVVEQTNSEEARVAAELSLNRIPVPNVYLPPVDTAESETRSETIMSVDGYLPIVE